MIVKVKWWERFKEEDDEKERTLLRRRNIIKFKCTSWRSELIAFDRVVENTRMMVSGGNGHVPENERERKYRQKMQWSIW